MDSEFAHSPDNQKQFKIRSRLQEERFQRVIAEVEDYAIVLLDRTGAVASWNRGAEGIEGYTAEEIVGRDFSVFYTREDRESGFPERLLQSAIKDNRVSHEGWLIRKNSTRFWGVVSIAAFHDAAGKVNGFVMLTRDLTERKVAEDNYSNFVEELRLKNQELRKSEARYHKMVSEVSDYVIIMLDREGKILDWNKGAENIKGYKAAEIVGKSFRLFYSKEDKDALLPDKLLQRAVDNGSVVHEGWRIRKDGSRFWGNVVITALHDDAGEIIAFSKVTRDLTDKKIADDKLRSYADELKFKNAELKRSEESYHRMVAEVQDYAIILLDEDGIIQNWNAGAEKIKGYRAYEIIGSSFEAFYPREDQAVGLPRKLLAEAAEKGRAVHEGWRVRKDGSRFWGYVVITALHNEQNHIIGFSKVTRDLTAKKEADDRLKENALELEARSKTLQRLNEEISSFAYVASHDLKEPLRKIQTFAHRILDNASGENTHEFAEKILTSASRMRRLMDDLLSFAQLSGSEALSKDVDLNAVLKTVLEDLELKITEKQSTIHVSRLPVISGIEFQLRQLFTNLISNALKFSKPGVAPVVTVSSVRVQGKDIPLGLVNGLTHYQKVTITDNGLGFDQADAMRIFEVFQRLHATKEASGTGIGLAIVKRIMENHGGTIHATSAPGQGAKFDMYFRA